MIKIVDITDEQLEKLKYLENKNESMESTTHPFYDNDKKKIFKLFKENTNIDNKVAKMELLNERLKDIEQVVTAESFIRYKGKIIGYTMTYINGKMFGCLTFNKKKNILVLKKIAEILKELHELNIVCADIINNVIVDKDGNPYLIDYDNFAVDNLKVDLKNLLLQKYEKDTKSFDYHFDNYLLNIFTLNILTKIHTPYIKMQYIANPHYFNFRDKEIRDIIDKTFDLNDVYTEDLIVDKINSKKDLKKIKLK